MEVEFEDNSNEKDIESDDDVNDGEEDDEKDDDEESGIERDVKEAEERVTANIYDYQSHIDVIDGLKKLAELERLRVARQRMSEQFPLTPVLWLDWLQDEMKLASTLEEKTKVKELFERAVKDYLSVNIWLEYVQFSIGIQDTERSSSFDDVRSVFERALTAAGLHVPTGALIWEAYIEYEIVILALLKNKGVQSEVEKQLKRLGTLFKRQLSCPLLDMDETYERFNMWLEENKTEGDVIVDKLVVELGYKKAKEKLTKIVPFEEALLSGTEKQLVKYREYVEHEKSKSGTPSRVQCLYERAVCDHCLQDSLWVEYINYISTVLDNGDVAVDVCQRAIRNCPWSCAIHQAYITCLEKFKRPHEQISAAMNQALSSGFQQAMDYQHIWMTYLEYLRRRSDDPDISKEVEERMLEDLVEAFGRAMSYLGNVPEADPDYNVAQFWARIEAIYRKNMEKSRELWSNILGDERHKTGSMWLEYIHLERAFGDSKHLRKLYPRALQNTWDNPDVIAKAWLNYERDEGTLDSYEMCVSKIEARMKQWREHMEKQEARRAATQQQMGSKPRGRAGLGYKDKWLPEPLKPAVGHKRKIRADDEDNNVLAPKKPNMRDNETNAREEESVSPSKKQRQESSEDIVENLLKEKQGTEHGQTVKHDSSKDDRTVFVSNLDFSTEESAVREALADCGTITDLRLVKDFKGRSKGFCYVEFQSIAEASNALKKDRHLILTRPMFVSKCDTDKETRASGFKYSTALEKRKLFVRGLPYSTTADELRTIFGQFGAVKEVRLVTFRNGHSKGLAYIDFEDEVSATQAIMKMDGTVLGDKEISVAISNPPGRKPEASKSLLSLGGGPKETGPRGRGRTQLSFMPRSLQLGTQQQTARQQLADLSISSPAAESAGAKKLSNSDFRNILNS